MAHNATYSSLEMAHSAINHAIGSMAIAEMEGLVL
jgi:hypothetical protein